MEFYSYRKNKPHVVALSISKGGIPKQPVDSAGVRYAGLEGDGHNHEKHNRPAQAVCLQDEEFLEELRGEGYPLYPGTIGENITVRNLYVQRLQPGDVLKFENGLTVQLTKERKPCYVLDSIDPKLKEAIMGRCGYYAQVLQEGMIRAGETVEVQKAVGNSNMDDALKAAMQLP